MSGKLSNQFHRCPAPGVWCSSLLLKLPQLPLLTIQLHGILKIRLKERYFCYCHLDSKNKMDVESIVSSTIERITEAVIKEAKFLAGVKDQVVGVQTELRWMSSYLKDLDGREEDSDERLRTSLRDIRMIAYDTEDLIDSFILRAASRKQESRLKRWVCIFKYLVHTHKAGKEIEKIMTRIKRTTEMLQGFQVDLNQGNNRARRASGEGARGPVRRMRRSFPHVADDHVVGLEEDIIKLVTDLLKKGTNRRFHCISGMGGSGKTTLARKLYNHDDIKQHFACQAWVSVSQEWVAQHILLEILRIASGQTLTGHEVWSHEEVVEKIYRFLEKKLYLIVLDDVWKKEALEEILPALPSGAEGSKVIITARIQTVLDFPNLRYSVHEPRRLNENEGWMLFIKIVLNHRDEASQFVITDEFEKLGREMLRRCEGLPLAIIALGGLLASKETIEEWEKFNEVMSSKIVAAGRGTHEYGPVKDMLALSYHDLPYELKPCFLYLTLFPEDHEIPAGMLIRMWIAEGFIAADQQTQGEQTLEEVGRGYLEELVQRCVVRVARRNYAGEVKAIQVHDLMRDLCIEKAREQEFLQNLSSGSSEQSDEAKKSRRASIHFYPRADFPLPTENAHLRSLFVTALTLHRVPVSLEPIHKNFSLLRVLHLFGINTCGGTLPKEIGKLIHLRYLRINLSNIGQLPESIGNLRNLLTLDYRYVYPDLREFKIPNVLWKMERLRHLFLPFERRSDMEELKLHNLKNLQTLWGIAGGNWMLKELPQLSAHLYRLRIYWISRKEQLKAVFQCPSILTHRLKVLDLGWEFEVEPHEIEPIYCCRSLHKLSLRGSIGKQLAQLRLPANIKKLRLLLTKLDGEETIAPLGKLQELKILSFEGDSYIGTRWTCHQGDFPQLEDLRIYDLPNLEEWTIEEGAMPCLKKLYLVSCKKLRMLPEGLKFMNTLQELELIAMAPPLYKKMRQGDEGFEEAGEYIEVIQHIPTIRVRERYF